jgi:group I intron endonuclease
MKVKHVPKCPGVYRIVNLVTGKVYVGSAAVSLRQRGLYHRSFLRRGKHDNTYLQRAWDKDGEHNFRFEVLETCETSACIEREQHWMDLLRSTDRARGYNLCPVARSGPMQGRRHSEATRRRMSEMMKGHDMSALTEAAARANRGRRLSPEVCQKRSEARKGKPKSLAHRAAIAAAHWSRGPNAAEIRATIAAKKRARDQARQQE